MTFFTGWVDPETGGGPDSTLPTITKVSPTTFNTARDVAAFESVVLDILDPEGLTFFTVTQGPELVYSGVGDPTGFSPAFSGSAITPLATGFRLTFHPFAGWSGTTVTLVVSAVSGGGVASASYSLALPNGEYLSGFRDTVWAWRRRLNRQKCSVVSISIDDQGAPNAGFTLTALSLELGRKTGLNRTPWRGGGYTNTSGSGTSNNGRE